MISIIMPIYNAQETLEKSLESLRNQTYTDIEVIMVDDGSADQSADICCKFVQADHRFKYHYQKNAGVSAARNTGIDLAQGEYITFCDADDWADANMYEFLYSLLQKTKADISVCSCYVDTKKSLGNRCASEDIFVYSGKEAFVEMNRGTRFRGFLWNKLYKRDCVGDIRLQQDIHNLEDSLFCAQVMVGCSKVAFQDVTLYHYVQQESSAMHTYREKFWSIQTASDRMCKLMEMHSPEHMMVAQKNAVVANLILARKIAEAKAMNVDYYERILQHIRSISTPEALAMLSLSDKRELALFKCGRYVYAVYVRLLVSYKCLRNK